MSTDTKINNDEDRKLPCRPKNFTEEEDMFLSCAYAKISLDPIKETTKNPTFPGKMF
jgi:hypothetical protein